MENLFDGKTEQEWLAEKEVMDNLYREGLEVEASENFRSQGAWRSLSSRYSDFARYAKQGGTARQIVLFDLEGNYIPGKWITNQFGSSWLTTDGRFLNPSKAQKGSTRIKNNAKKGFYEGEAMFKVYYDSFESEVYCKTKNPEELVSIIDNGQ